MAKLKLNVANARALAQKLRRHRVAERVGMHATLDRRPISEALERPLPWAVWLQSGSRVG